MQPFFFFFGGGGGGGGERGQSTNCVSTSLDSLETTIITSKQGFGVANLTA